MDLLSVLFSVNKVALIFFILVFGFVLYEFILFLRETREIENPVVPDFDRNTVAPTSFTKIASPIATHQDKSVHKKHRPIILLISIVILLVLGSVTLLYKPAEITKTKSRIEGPTVTPRLTVSTKTAPKANANTLPFPTANVQPTQTPTTVPTLIPTVIPSLTPVQARTVVDEVAVSKATPEVTTTLPAAGSNHFLLILTVAASVVVAVSLLF